MKTICQRGGAPRPQYSPQPKPWSDPVGHASSIFSIEIINDYFNKWSRCDNTAALALAVVDMQVAPFTPNHTLSNYSWLEQHHGSAVPARLLCSVVAACAVFRETRRISETAAAPCPGAHSCLCPAFHAAVWWQGAGRAGTQEWVSARRRGLGRSVLQLLWLSPGTPCCNRPRPCSWRTAEAAASVQKRRRPREFAEALQPCVFRWTSALQMTPTRRGGR
jgi:hypothetical protein